MIRKVAIQGVRSLATAVPRGSYLPASEVTERVINVVKTFKSASADVDITKSFVADLKFDSLIRKDFIIRLEEEFCVDVPAIEANNFLSVGDAVNFFAGHPKAR